MLAAVSAPGHLGHVPRVYVTLGKAVYFVVAMLGIVALIAISGVVARRLKAVKRASQGAWSKPFVFVSVERNGTRTAYMTVILVLRTTGVLVQRQNVSGWGRVGFDTVVNVPWSALTAIEYVARASRWSRVVLRGPEIAIAPTSAVDDRFAEATGSLGATVPQ